MAVYKPRTEVWVRSSVTASEETSPADTLINNFQLPELGDNTSLNSLLYIICRNFWHLNLVLTQGH